MSIKTHNQNDLGKIINMTGIHFRREWSHNINAIVLFSMPFLVRFFSNHAFVFVAFLWLRHSTLGCLFRASIYIVTEGVWNSRAKNASRSISFCRCHCRFLLSPSRDSMGSRHSLYSGPPVQLLDSEFLTMSRFEKSRLLFLWAPSFVVCCTLSARARRIKGMPDCDHFYIMKRERSNWEKGLLMSDRMDLGMLIFLWWVWAKVSGNPHSSPLWCERRGSARKVPDRPRKHPRDRSEMVSVRIVKFWGTNDHAVIKLSILKSW